LLYFIKGQQWPFPNFVLFLWVYLLRSGLSNFSSLSRVLKYQTEEEKESVSHNATRRFHYTPQCAVML
jgi:hypothetical protein